MLQIRLHGRGGQGVVTAAEMLSLAAFYENKHAQAFPSFGSERTGAPVVAYARIGDKEIRTHEPIMYPNAVLVQDRTLLTSIDVFAGLKDDGYAIINTKEAPEDIVPELVKRLPKGHVITVPCTDIAMEKLKKSLPGAPILASLAALTGIYKLENVQKAYQSRYPGAIGDANADAAAVAYEYVMKSMENK